MTKRISMFLLAMLTLGLVSAVGTLGAGAQGPELVARMNGANVVPGPGDPDGYGRAWLYEEDGQACVTITWHDIAQPDGAHIHRGVRGEAGPVVAHLFDKEQTGRRTEYCTSDYDPDLAADVVAHPGNYYVQLHNEGYPNGAIRGQLREL